MLSRLRITDPGRTPPFDVVSATDPAELDHRSRISGRLPASGQSYRYHLRDRALWRGRFEEPIFSLAIRSAGALAVSYATSRFATDVALEGEEGPLFCVMMPTRGSVTLMRDGAATTVDEWGGIALRPGPRTRLLLSDDSARSNVFIAVREVEQALEQALDQRLRQPLEFLPGLHWHGGLALSLKRQLDAVLAEFQLPNGVTGNPVALASTTDLVITLLLLGAPHTYSDQLESAADGAVPAYVRRAEDFMRANGAAAIRIAQVAVAAGCSLRTLNDVFRRFRGTTPLGALHGIRLERVRSELLRGDTDASVAAVARSHGFTNFARFSAAFRRRFGETPSDARRRAVRT